MSRNIGVDLLKIILAFMVITLHVFANGTGQVLKYSTVFPYSSFSLFVTFLCYPAVNTYILISGFYSYAFKKELLYVIRSLSLLWLSALFFSVLGYVFIEVIIYNRFDFFEFIIRLFPITRGEWWFYSVYFALMLLSPFINKMIDILDILEHKMLIFVLLFLLSFLPFFVSWKDSIGSNFGYSLVWFLTLYLTGAYLNRDNFLEKKYCKSLLTVIFVLIFLTLSLYFLPRILHFLLSIFGVDVNVTFAMYNSLIVYGQAISLFVLFANIKIPKCFQKIICSISSFALASYLLHCQEDIEKFLWQWVNPSAYANSVKLPFVLLMICIVIFVLGVTLEYIRKNVFSFFSIDKYAISIASSCYKRIENSLNK